jgi:uncharacterized protein with FMN-binding domain
MNAETREPTRLPVRGTIGLVGTVGALALLLSFRGAPSLLPEAVVAVDDEAPASDELLAATATESSAAEAVVEAQTLIGDLIETRFGDLQLEVTLEGSDIIEVVALSLPDDDSRSADISDDVGPILREEAIAYDTADVSVISGATYTSEAYADSLQSALDQAGVADATVVAGSVAEAPVEKVAVEVAVGETMTATGQAVAIRWGDVQVAVTVQGHDIIDVETLAIPDGDGKSRRINRTAEPILREEAIAGDTADVSVISGATYTSEAYATSLQSALDQLGV